MSSSKLTLVGMAKYFSMRDGDLFKNLELPAGIDKETLVDAIVMRGGDFEVLYPNAEYMQSAIGAWSKKWQRTFIKWYTALNIQYNPLENYDRQETESSNGSSTDKTTGSGTSNTSSSVSAFNSSYLEPDGATHGSSTSSTEGNTTLSNNRTARVHGNIGVTTSQQMLQSELDIATWNLYESIASLFLSEFVIPLY